MEKAEELQKKYSTLLNNYGINNRLRKAMFWAQLDHESGLKPVSENLNYSYEGLLKVFPKYFDKNSAKEYARKPEKIANKVYANRMGNGNEQSGDGWKFRGRGFIQCTGRNNYTILSKDTRVNYEGNPDLLLNEADALISALWYWNKNNLNTMSDKGDLLGVTKAINGGLNGLQDREVKYKKYLKVFL